MQLQINDDIQVVEEGLKLVKPYQIENFEELKAELINFTNHYKELEVTEEGVTQAKKDRALLSKVKDALEGNRKYAQKKIQELYATGTAQIKELVALVDDARDNLDKQVKDFENREKEQKKALIEELIANKHYDTIPNLPFEEKWLNKGVSLKQVEEELDKIVNSYTSNVTTLKTLIKDQYDLQMAYNDYITNGFNIDNAIARHLERQKLKDTQKVVEEVESKKVTIGFVVNCSKDKAVLLASFMNSNNIQFTQLTSQELKALKDKKGEQEDGK